MTDTKHDHNCNSALPGGECNCAELAGIPQWAMETARRIDNDYISLPRCDTTIHMYARIIAEAAPEPACTCSIASQRICYRCATQAEAVSALEDAYAEAHSACEGWGERRDQHMLAYLRDSTKAILAKLKGGDAHDA